MIPEMKCDNCTHLQAPVWITPSIAKEVTRGILSCRNALAIKREQSTTTFLNNLDENQIPSKGFNFTAFSKPKALKATSIAGSDDFRSKTAQVFLVAGRFVATLPARIKYAIQTGSSQEY